MSVRVSDSVGEAVVEYMDETGWNRFIGLKIEPWRSGNDERPYMAEVKSGGRTWL
jgi:hypothetical protein